MSATLTLCFIAHCIECTYCFCCCCYCCYCQCCYCYWQTVDLRKCHSKKATIRCGYRKGLCKDGREIAREKTHKIYQSCRMGGTARKGWEDDSHHQYLHNNKHKRMWFRPLFLATFFRAFTIALCLLNQLWHENPKYGH